MLDCAIYTLWSAGAARASQGALHRVMVQTARLAAQLALRAHCGGPHETHSFVLSLVEQAEVRLRPQMSHLVKFHQGLLAFRCAAQEMKSDLDTARAEISILARRQ